MILKYSYLLGRFEFVKCKKLKCSVENVAYFKQRNKYVAFDIPTGILICKSSTLKQLIQDVDFVKEKTLDIRCSENYKKWIGEKENALAINTIEEVKNEQ